jgi:hypothetical protein
MRTAIADLVRSIQAGDALERDHIDATLAWIESGAPLCPASIGFSLRQQGPSRFNVILFFARRAKKMTKEGQVP